VIQSSWRVGRMSMTVSCSASAKCSQILVRWNSNHLLPGLKRITPAVPIDVLSDPSATSTVEVEIFVGSVDDLEAF